MSTSAESGHHAPPTSLTFTQVVRLVARREVVERSREKSFAFSTGLTLLILLGVILVPPLLGVGDPPSFRVAFADDAPGYAAAAEQVAEQVEVDLEVVDADGEPAHQQVADGELDAYVEARRIVVDDELDSTLGLVLEQATSQVRVGQQLAEAGIDPAAVARAQSVGPLLVESLNPPDPAASARQGIAFAGTFVLYGQLVGYGFWVATGIVEEKSSRVVEVLLATVRPRALLAGKVLGIGVLALGQLLLLAAVGLGAATASGLVVLGADAVTPVLLVLGWFVLGFAFYACLFAAGAARVSRQEDLQSVTTPATMLVLASFLGALYVNNNPDSVAGQVLGVLPPFSALVSPARIAGGEAAPWEPALSVALMLLAIAGLVAAAARIYEGSVLRMGATVSLRDAWRSRQQRDEQ